jgi:hypothetical protein
LPINFTVALCKVVNAEYFGADICLPNKIFEFCLQDSDGQGCPFCRAEIKGTEQVIVDPFDPRGMTRVSASNIRNSPSVDEDDDAFEVIEIFYQLVATFSISDLGVFSLQCGG